MARKPFYKISESTYLFSTQTETAISSALSQKDKKEQLEEPIRQWCAYELIRAYGIMISDLEFEHKVQIGSKTYRIDILVVRGGFPWAVIECKKSKHRKSEDGMKQAISYANAEEIGAEYAVYTNGKVWLVQRRIQDRWIPVPDIPEQTDRRTQIPIDELLAGIHIVAPLLHKLDEKMDGDDARTFLAAMQRFFYGKNLFTREIDDDLRFATDNLLRVMMSVPDTSARPVRRNPNARSRKHNALEDVFGITDDSAVGRPSNYECEKFRAALDFFERYRKRARLGYPIYQVEHIRSINEEVRSLYATFTQLAEGTRNLVNANAFVVRINVALLEYGMLRRDFKTPFQQIEQSLHNALRDFLNYVLAVHLNVKLPDSIDRGTTEDMKSFCSSDWEDIHTLTKGG